MARERDIRPAGGLVLLLVLLMGRAYAGGPRYVAGASYFDTSVKGTPLIWAQGSVDYYTDKGNLSPLLPGSDADAFVADAFSRWTSVPSAAVSAIRAGQLAEDVSGSNVVGNSDGSLTMPGDILPSATQQPVAVVYDADGSVIDALLGSGASGALLCSTNSVLGAPDNLGADGHFLHALVVLNGNCAQTASQLADLKYRLVRTLGRILGLDWSQANINVVTGTPAPAAADYSGFPLMHAVDSIACSPISRCYPAGMDPSQLRPDDQAAISRLYPVTAQNLASFPGKATTSANTVRIHGAVHFVDANGQLAQPMQGVNVVARWVDPVTGVASRQYVASSVSGFAFRGNAGNPVTGFTDPLGRRYDRFGSDDSGLEGFFDIAGLQVPTGASSVEFELTVEAVDPVWSYGIQPYGTMQVLPSGNMRFFVFAGQGQDILQDLAMTASSIDVPESFGITTYAAPAMVPPGGDWLGSLSPHGDTDYFQFPGRANRSLSVSVTALDESGNASQSKAQPVIGIWGLGAPESSPATVNTLNAFNVIEFGETRLDALLQATVGFRIGVADFRGDGRPDYRYHARVLYGDTATPGRLSVAGGTPLSIRGLGFQPGDGVMVGQQAAAVLALSSNQFLVTAPAQPDGVRDISLADPATGGSSVMSGAVTYGAALGDTIRIVSGGGQKAPVGGSLPAPIVIQALATDGGPVAGASVALSTLPAASLSACSGNAACTLLTDDGGRVSTNVTMLSSRAVTFTAQLAPATYNPPATAQTTVSGTSSTLDIALAPQAIWVAQGASLTVPLTARVLSGGAPLVARTVNFRVQKGTALLSQSSGTTDTGGLVSSSVELSGLSGDVQVSACIQNQPVDNPCLALNVTAVAASNLQLQAVSGGAQIAIVGQNFEPVVIRVTDLAVPPHPVSGAAITAQLLVARAPQNSQTLWIGDTGITPVAMPVILASSQFKLQSDANGLVTFTPANDGVQGPVIILGTFTAGTSSSQFALQSFAPMIAATVPSVNLESKLRKDEDDDTK